MIFQTIPIAAFPSSDGTERFLSTEKKILLLGLGFWKELKSFRIIYAVKELSREST
jgi:hypothetical protein